jgi:autotransporter-associated beta strand protein
VIYGPGAVVKTGVNSLTLNGANLYAGGTTINAGTIKARNASALGTGNVVHNSATLDLDLTTLNIGGTYTQNGSSTLKVGISGTLNGSIVASGIATVTATDSLVLDILADVPLNTSYTIIDGAAGGHIVAPVVTVLGSGTLFSVTGIGNSLILTSISSAYNFVADALNGNAYAVAKVLDDLTNPSGDMAYVLRTLNGLSSEEIGAALDTLYAQIDGGIISISSTFMNNSIGFAKNRVRGLLSKAETSLHNPRPAESIMPVRKSQDFAMGLRNEAVEPAAATGISSGDEYCLNGLWASGYGSYLNQGKRHGIVGYSAWNAGTVIGFDRMCNDAVILGVSGGYAYADVDSNTPNYENTEIHSAQCTLYGAFVDPHYPCFMDVTGYFSHNWYNGEREINIGNIIVRRAKSNYGGQQYAVCSDGGFRINLNEDVEIDPLLSVYWNHLGINGYTETGADSINLNLKKQTYNQLLSGLGIRVLGNLESESGKIISEAHVRWFYDYIGDPMAVTSNFTGGGASFATNGCKPARNSFNAGGQILFDMNNDHWVIGAFDLELKGQFFGAYASLTLRY